MGPLNEMTPERQPIKKHNKPTQESHCAPPPVSNIFLRPSMPDMASTFLRQSPTSEVSTWDSQDKWMIKINAKKKTYPSLATTMCESFMCYLVLFDILLLHRLEVQHPSPLPVKVAFDKQFTTDPQQLLLDNPSESRPNQLNHEADFRSHTCYFSPLDVPSEHKKHFVSAEGVLTGERGRGGGRFNWTGPVHLPLRPCSSSRTRTAEARGGGGGGTGPKAHHSGLDRTYTHKDTRGQPLRSRMQRDAGWGGGPHDSSQSAGCNDGGDARRAERWNPAEPDTVHHKPATERETPLQG
ncbi:hypothetical protein INR49_012324 [Caranx melampygus]|nr:hypothetical protein INR49_012324 [Caranx melampygus]